MATKEPILQTPDPPEVLAKQIIPKHLPHLDLTSRGYGSLSAALQAPSAELLQLRPCVQPSCSPVRSFVGGAGCIR